jgi:hypothetical protein
MSLELLDFMKIENSQFVKLLVSDVAKKNICDGHLYLSVGERKFYLMKPGVFVDPDFIKKQAINNHEFDFQSVIDQDAKEQFKKHFNELKSMKLEKELRGKCTEILSYFCSVYSTEAHFLSFAMACYEEFCELPIPQQLMMHETDMYLFRKSFYSAAFSILVGISNDFYHFPMLRDFYNVTFSLDIGLCEISYSYFVAEACNLESRMPGSGRGYLENEKATELEKDTFIAHPEKSYEMLKSLNILNFPELAEAVLFQHELSNGSGFPRGVFKAQVSTWEAVIIFSDAIVEILPEYNFETNVMEFLTGFKSRKLLELPVSKVFRKLFFTLKHFKKIKDTGT